MDFLETLTKKERKLVDVLLDNEVATKVDLLVNGWGYPRDMAEKMTDQRTTDITVARVRKKLPPHVNIHTVRGVGYRLELG
ncbi:MAG: winged helix-turn-helix domain-containing protein [Pseudomonadales bacterium]|jgi:DNA-binding response OmpR family regulator